MSPSIINTGFLLMSSLSLGVFVWVVLISWKFHIEQTGKAFLDIFISTYPCHKE